MNTSRRPSGAAKAAEEKPPLGERYEVREELRFCVYRVGEVDPIGICKLKADADNTRTMLERDEWPWYSRPKS